MAAKTAPLSTGPTDAEYVAAIVEKHGVREATARMLLLVAKALSHGDPGYRDDEGVFHDGLTDGDVLQAAEIISAINEAGYGIFRLEEIAAMSCPTELDGSAGSDSDTPHTDHYGNPA